MNLLGLACYTLIIFLSVDQTELAYEPQLLLADTVVQADTLDILCVGDIMLGTDYPSGIYLPPGRECSPLLATVANVLVDADITCGNLEGTFAGKEGEPKKCKDTTQCFVFRMPDHFVECLVSAGFDFLSLANNHNGDFGAAGRERTRTILENAGIKTAGLQDHPVSYIRKDSITYGFCAFSPHPGTTDLTNSKQVQGIISMLDSECDIVIVSFHGGAEGKDHQHVTRGDETYLGFNRGNVYEFAHIAVDAGADIVFGHGPHVTRAAECYRERIILYSLGNFCTYGRFKLEGPNGVAPMVRLSVDKEGKFLKGKVFPIVQRGRGIPEIDYSGKAITELKDLTKTDFPDALVDITDDGMILPAGTENGLTELEYDQDSLKVIPRINTYLGNERRNYYGNSAPSQLKIIWKLYLGKGETLLSRKLGTTEWAGAGWTGQPLLVEENGELFIIQGAYDHHLKKIRAETGEIVWQYAFDDVVKGTGTIWVNGNADHPEEQIIILQGSRLGSGNYLDSPHIPSFRAISYLTGTELWRLDSQWTDSYSRDVDGSALMIADTGYIGLENGLFTVFDPDPQKARMLNGMIQPQIIKSRKLYTPDDVKAHQYNVVTEASPSLLGNRIYLSSGSGHVFGFNRITMEIDWDFFIGSDMDGTPVVTNDSCLLVSVEKQYIPGKGGVFKLDPARDERDAVIWFLPTENHDFVSWKGGVIGSVGINDYYKADNTPGLAATIGIDGYLYVVNHQEIQEEITVAGPDSISYYPTPELIFKTYLGPSISSPVFIENRLIVAGYNGLFLFEFNQDFEFILLDKFVAPIEATPIAWNNRIYIASRDGYLYCLGEEE